MRRRDTIDAADYVAGQAEDDFQATVIAHAEYRGWVCSHTRDSRREEEGEPDLRCWRGPDYILAELKTETGRERPSQRLWRLRAEQRWVTVHLWKPSSWETIEDLLR